MKAKIVTMYKSKMHTKEGMRLERYGVVALSDDANRLTSWAFFLSLYLAQAMMPHDAESIHPGP